MRFAKTLELSGIPTVALTAQNVSRYVSGYDRLYSNGMPIRIVTFPLPVAGVPTSIHEKYVAGNDPITGKPIMQSIIDGLTKPLTADETATGLPPEGASQPRMLPADTEENLQQLFRDNDWTDYGPIILPTEVRVAAMLKGTSRKSDEVVKTINWPAGSRKLTVEKAAICAVMAGAKPQQFPLILAVATQVPFGNSTTSMANAIIVNGPIRHELKMNSGGNAMGPHNEANSVIGRTLTLMSKSVGNLHSGRTTFSSLGSNLQYNNLCLAEAEEDLPQGWLPLSQQFGYKPTDSIVSIGTGWSYVSSAGEAMPQYPPQMLIRDYMKALSGQGGGATIFMDPLVAGMLHDYQKFATKEAFGQWLAANVKIPVAQFWGNGVVTTFSWTLGLQGLEPYATWQKIPQDQLIQPFNNPKGINTVVVGGKTQTTWFVTDFRLRSGVSVDAWR
jgi:hypothetical protein